MYISLPTVMMTAAVAHGVVAIPVVPYQSDRFASSEFNTDVNQFTKRTPGVKALVETLSLAGLLVSYIGGAWVTFHNGQEERLEDKQGESLEGNEEENGDANEQDKSIESDGNVSEDEDEDKDK